MSPRRKGGGLDISGAGKRSVKLPGGNPRNRKGLTMSTANTRRGGTSRPAGGSRRRGSYIHPSNNKKNRISRSALIKIDRSYRLLAGARDSGRRVRVPADGKKRAQVHVERRPALERAHRNGLQDEPVLGRARQDGCLVSRGRTRQARVFGTRLRQSGRQVHHVPVDSLPIRVSISTAMGTAASPRRLTCKASAE